MRIVLLLAVFGLLLTACDSAAPDPPQQRYAVIIYNVVAGSSGFSGTTSFFYPDGVESESGGRSGLGANEGILHGYISQPGARGVSVEYEITSGTIRVEIRRGTRATWTDFGGDIVASEQRMAGQTLSLSHGHTHAPHARP